MKGDTKGRYRGLAHDAFEMWQRAEGHPVEFELYLSAPGGNDVYEAQRLSAEYRETELF